VVFRHTVTGAGLGQNECGSGAGKISQIPLANSFNPHRTLIDRDGFTHRPWPRAPRNDLFYDDSMLTKNLQNCAEA